MKQPSSQQLTHPRPRQLKREGLCVYALYIFSLLTAICLLYACDFGTSSTPSVTPTATAVSPGQVITGTVRELGALANPPSVKVRDGGPSGLVGGKMLWTFGDTILTQPNEDGVMGITNSAATAPLSNPMSLTATLDSTGAPVLLVPYTEEEVEYNRERGNKGDDRYALWPASVVGLDDGSGLVFFAKLLVKPGNFNFASVATGVARIEAGSTVAQREPDLLFQEPEPLFREGALVADKHVYLWACKMDGVLDSACKVARAPVDRAREREVYRFWDGSEWIDDTGRAVEVLRGPTSGVSVSWNQHLGGYLAVYSGIVSSKVMARTAPSPEGPWSQPVELFSGQAPGPDLWNYTGVEHPELAQDGGRVIYVSYYRPLGVFDGELRLVEVELR